MRTKELHNCSLLNTRYGSDVRFKVFTAVIMVITFIFSVLAPYSYLCRQSLRFEETHRLHFQGSRLIQYVSPKRWHLPINYAAPKQHQHHD